MTPEEITNTFLFECHLFSDTTPKFSTTLSHPIPALFYFERTGSDPTTYPSQKLKHFIFLIRPHTHTLTLSADFYVPDLMYWLSLTLPSIPDRLTDELKLTYTCPITNAFLSCCITYHPYPFFFHSFYVLFGWVGKNSVCFHPRPSLHLEL